MALFLIFFNIPGLRAQSLKDRPNVLLITIDTLTPDRLSCYDSAVLKTPNIDALAQRGFLFSRAFAHNPLTLPSHANILLGLTPLVHGVHDNANFIVRKELTNLAGWLKGRGYATGAFVGAFPLDSRFGLTTGFDVYDDNYGSQGPNDLTFVERKAEVVIQLALRWLADQGGPWFLWIHLFDPHQPYEPPEPFRTQYKDSPYNGEVAYVDAALGKLFGFLKDKNLGKRTLTVFTADHGESLGEHGEMTHGYFAYNATLWVPLIIFSPGGKAGSAAQNVCHIDIFPTICDLLGIEAPPSLQGRSLAPLMKGKELPARPIYFEALTAYYNRGWAPLRGYIEGREKFMDSPISELYDIETDFHEQNNLAASADLGTQRQKYERLLKTLSAPAEGTAGQKLDRETQEKLRSLGYVASYQAPAKKNFTEKDDLKTLLPYHTKCMKAVSAYSKGQVEEGIALLKEIIAERKDFDLAYTHLANFYKKQKRLKDAVSVLLDAYQNNPSSFRIMTTYGIFLVDAGRFDEAVEVLKKGLALIDFDPEVWNYLGVAYWSQGDYDAARKAYERALALDSNYPNLINNLGSLHLSLFLKTRQPDPLRKALDYFKQAIALDPRYPSAYNGLGSALNMAGDADGAIENWKKAVELKPDFGFPLYNLGLTYLARGDKALALDYFMKYKNMFYAGLPAQEKEKLDALIQSCMK
ncbi:MAG: sulfatase-like hydrolase/transferase [Candidatus Aminicenantes bacterium]|nr:sulfatase-like hydrolase/transferase [Candidatus Aminicenantes bacterium]